MKPITLEINEIRAIIFDLDNTLVSCELNFSQLRQQLGCPQEIDLLCFVEAMTDKQAQRHAEQTILDHELSDAKRAQPLPGCHALLHYLKQQQIKSAIVTRNCLQASQLKLEQTQIDIEHLITREHCAPKPDPEALIQLATQWRLEPHQILYVGDYLYDLEAAYNADMPSCLVTNGEDKGFASLASITVTRLDELQEKLQQRDV
ncbi:HAD family hydrolase [Vibrio vulnificus]|nr:HAD family hydrolase [Vibrio vulnificus]